MHTLPEQQIELRIQSSNATRVCRWAGVQVPMRIERPIQNSIRNGVIAPRARLVSESIKARD